MGRSGRGGEDRSLYIRAETEDQTPTLQSVASHIVYYINVIEMW
jgi:hypothetical protein